MKQNIVIIVQARMGSQRLPGKVMRQMEGMFLLDILLDRLSLVKNANCIIVATTNNPQDDCIEARCHLRQIDCFRGSEENVLDRYLHAAEKANAETIVRITADCPLIDPQIIDETIQAYLDCSPPCDYVSNSLERTFPRGMDVEVFSLSALKEANKCANIEEKEHVTLFLYRHPERFKLKNVTANQNQSQHRWTVDTEEDFQLVSNLFHEVFPTHPTFSYQDLLNVMNRHPKWIEINAHIEQKKTGGT